MNEKVEKLINEKKDLLEKKERQVRKDHLRSIGLIDENKKEREYHPSGVNYDYEKGMSYSELEKALDITDEEYKEICKYYPVKDTSNYNELIPVENTSNYNELIPVEKMLNIVANIILICGIICSIICLFTITFMDSGGYTYHSDVIFNPMGLVITICILLFSLVSWVILKSICSILINVKQINNKIK